MALKQYRPLLCQQPDNPILWHVHPQANFVILLCWFQVASPPRPPPLLKQRSSVSIKRLLSDWDCPQDLHFCRWPVTPGICGYIAL